MYCYLFDSRSTYLNQDTFAGGYSSHGNVLMGRFQGVMLKSEETRHDEMFDACGYGGMPFENNEIKRCGDCRVLMPTKA